MTSLAALHRRDLRRPNDDIYADETFRRIYHSSKRMVERVSRGLPDDFRVADEVPDRVSALLQWHDILPSDIIDAVCIEADISRMDLLSKQRATRVAHPRMLACWLMRSYTTLSFKEIGREVRKDHTTAMHAYEQIPHHLERPGRISDIYGRVRGRLGL